MFRVKYTVSILDSKWQPVKRGLKLSVVPRQGEFIFMDGKYFNVLNLVHTLSDKQEIFVIIEDLPKQPQNNLLSVNQEVK